MITHTSNPDTKLWLIGKVGSGSIIYDYSPNGNNGTLVNSPSWVALNNGNFGIDYNGSTQLTNCGNITEFNNVSHLTWMFWVYIDNLTDYTGFMTKRIDNNNATDMIMSGSGLNGNTALLFKVANGSNTYGYTSAGVISAGRWFHLAMVFDGTTSGNSDRLKCYVNGQLKTMTYVGTIPTTTDDNTANVELGIGNGGYSDCKISQILGVPKSLTPSEVLKDYQQTFIS